jgi:dTDP-4-amino-4,6-dideoxygalactose transaminase
MGTHRRIPLSQPAVDDEEWQALRAPIESGWLAQGEQVREFERVFAERHQVKYSVATSSGTTALHLALLGLDVGPGDEVIVPAFTWVATANAVLYTGARPIFVDVSPDNYNIDLSALRDAVTPSTKAIIPVHLFGLCVDMGKLGEILPPAVKVVEDAACAAGAAFEGRAAGSLGDVGCFSFHPRKIITTGEGGMITTNNSDYADFCRAARNHGAFRRDVSTTDGTASRRAIDYEMLGYNYRLTDLQAAIGLQQLAKLDRFIAERTRWAEWYRSELDPIPWLECPRVPDRFEHAWQAYVVRVSRSAPLGRDDLIARLEDAGIETGPGTQAVPELPFYRQRLGLAHGAFPNASELFTQSIALPLHNRMRPDDYARVVQVLQNLSATKQPS